MSSKEDMEMFKRLGGFIQHTPESWAKIPKQVVEAIPENLEELEPVPSELTDEEYNAKVKEYLDFSPLRLMNDAFYRVNEDPPTLKYHEEKETGMYTCTIRYNYKVFSGTFRHKKTAGHIAATYLLEDAIRNDDSEDFFLPRDMEEALKLMEAKREALMKIVVDDEGEQPFRCVHDYAQYLKLKIEDECTDGPPYTTTLTFDGITYQGKPARTKKESKANAAKLICDELIRSEKYQKYKADKKAKTKERRDLKTASGSKDESAAKADDPNGADEEDKANEPPSSPF